MNSLLGVAAQRQAVYFKQLFNNLPNPNLLIASSGSNKAVTFSNAKNDAHIWAVIQTRKSGVLSQMFEIQGDDTNKQYIPFIEKIFDNLDVRKIIEDILDAPLIGFQAMEIYWQKVFIDNKQRIIPRQVIAKPQDWFFFDSNNQIRFNNKATLQGELLKPKKFLIVQHQASYDNPYGDAILSKCLWPLVFKKGGMTFWLKFTEKFSMPHLVGKTDAVSGSEDYAEFETQLDNLIQDASAVINNTDSIDILNPGSSLNVNIYDALLSFCNSEISKAILSETLTTEIGNTGSYAASQTHNSVLQTVIGSDKYLVESTMNQLIAWVVEINFGKEITPPKFVMYMEEDVDKPLAEVVDLITKNGQIKLLEKFYIDRFGFKADEFKLLEPQISTTPTGFSDHAGSDPDNTSDQILIDAFADRALKENSAEYLKYATTISKYLEKFDSIEAAQTHIAEILPDMDTKEIERKLTNLLFMADVIGRISVQQEQKHG